MCGLCVCVVVVLVESKRGESNASQKVSEWCLVRLLPMASSNEAVVGTNDDATDSKM